MKNQLRFSLILAIAIIGRFTLLDSGFLNDLDEYLFVWIQKNDGNLLKSVYWFKAVNEVQAQLPELFLRSVQYKLISWFYPESNCQFSIHFLKWIGYFNCLVVILQAIVFRKIILKYFSSYITADFLVAIWLVFANTNLYCKHILPYDHSLLFWLLAIYFSFSNKNFTHWIAGFFAALGILTYWGSVPALFFFGFTVLQRYRKFKLLPFIAPFCILLFGIEVLAKVNEFSYLSFLINYQSTIHTGNFDEGFIFPILYFVTVENLIGIFLLILFICSVFIILREKKKEDLDVFYPAIFSILFFSILVYFAHFFVWYGRVLHFVLPFMLLVSYKVLKIILDRKGMLYLLGLFLFITYTFQLFSWNKIQYPRNFIEKNRSESDDSKFEFETKVGLRLDENPFIEICYKSKKSNNQGKILLVNAGFLADYPSSKFLNSKQKIKIPKSYKLTKAGLHFQSHPFYQFEYNDRIGRNYFDKNRFQIRLYRFESDFSR
jgi:hypothetical protein